MNNYIILDNQNSLDILYIFIKNINNSNSHLYLPNPNVILNISNNHNFIPLLNIAVSKAKNIINNHFNKDVISFNHLNNPWKFIILNSNCFFGFPTTINDVIILPNVNYLHNDFNLTKTIIHEKLHIFQRYNLQNWNKYILLNTNWKYFYVNKLPPHFIHNINKIKNNYVSIYNPDVNHINDIIYLYHNHNYYYGYHILHNNKLKYNWIQIEDKDFIDLNNNNNNNNNLPKHEHPLEILAYDYADTLSVFI